MEKVNLFGMSLDELGSLCASEGMPRFAAKQICDWLYAKHVLTIDEMTNLSLKARARLNEIAYIGRHTPVDCQVSKDGTKKYLFEIEIENSKLKIENYLEATANSQFSTLNSQLKNYVEAVFIPDDDRGTLCISCQVGCKMGCRFCVTGQQGFHGNLSAADILNQIFSIPEYERLTNISIWVWVSRWTTSTMCCAAPRCLPHLGDLAGAPNVSQSPPWASYRE